MRKKVIDDFISDGNFKRYSNVAFISIIDCDNNENRYTQETKNFLQVKMWDIEEDVGQYKKPSDEEILKIFNFINDNSTCEYFVIHCSAGISRSGAVTRFLLEKFNDEIDKEKFNRDNKHILPNLYILNKLREYESR